MNIHWKDWCWSWISNTLATWCKELWKRPWCWERLKAGGEGDGRGWDHWMALPTQCTCVWANSRRWYRTGKPGVLQSMRSQTVRQDLAIEQQQSVTWWQLFDEVPVLLHVSWEFSESSFLFHKKRFSFSSRCLFSLFPAWEIWVYGNFIYVLIWGFLLLSFS